MGIASLGILYRMLGREEDAARMLAIAKEKAEGFLPRARNQDGSYRLAFDREGTFSLKYNLIWDQLFGLDLFPVHFREAEINRYKREAHAYGTPLDSRRTYTLDDIRLVMFFSFLLYTKAMLTAAMLARMTNDDRKRITLILVLK